jgi:hypothetical protein
MLTLMLTTVLLSQAASPGSPPREWKNGDPFCRRDDLTTDRSDHGVEGPGRNLGALHGRG